MQVIVAKGNGDNGVVLASGVLKKVTLLGSDDLATIIAHRQFVLFLEKK